MSCRRTEFRLLYAYRYRFWVPFAERPPILAPWEPTMYPVPGYYQLVHGIHSQPPFFQCHLSNGLVYHILCLTVDMPLIYPSSLGQSDTRHQRTTQGINERFNESKLVALITSDFVVQY